MLGTFLAAQRNYGDVVRFRGPLAVSLLSHPDHVDHVLHQNHRNYRHPDFEIQKLKPTFRNGLVTSQGDFWRRQRRLAQPAFHRRRIAAFASVMTDTTAELLERWEPQAREGGVLDIRPVMQRLTLEILMRAMFSADWGAEAETVMEAVTIANEHTNRRLLAPVNPPDWIPLPSTRRFLATREAVDALVYRLIAERRRSGEDKADLLSQLLGARDEDTGESMSDEQLHDELISMIFAGHETVSLGLTWTWYLLATAPPVLRRLQQEVAEVLEGRTPTADDVPNLAYTTMVIEEALRLYPPIWLVPRAPIEDDEVGGYRLRAGTMVFLCPYVTHRHRDFWEEPEGFDPERFTPERSAGRPRYAWFPFGGGPRQCIGAPFALLEMQLVVAMMAQRYRLTLLPGHPIALEPMVTLRPRHGMLMTVSKVGDVAGSAPG
jgi:cytochrome P450